MERDPLAEAASERAFVGPSVVADSRSARNEAFGVLVSRSAFGSPRIDLVSDSPADLSAGVFPRRSPAARLPRVPDRLALTMDSSAPAVVLVVSRASASPEPSPVCCATRRSSMVSAVDAASSLGADACSVAAPGWFAGSASAVTWGALVPGVMSSVIVVPTAAGVSVIAGVRAPEADTGPDENWLRPGLLW